MPGATSRPPTTVMGQIMATFALPKDNDKDKDKDKHKDQDHQIPDKTSNTIKVAWYDSSTVALLGCHHRLQHRRQRRTKDVNNGHLLQVTFFVAIVIIF